MADIATAQIGPWSATSTWTGGVVPGTTDTATLNHDVTVDVTASCAGITNNGNGKTLTVADGVVLTSSGSVLVDSPGSGDNPTQARTAITLQGTAVIELDPASGQTAILRCGDGNTWGQHEGMITATGTSSGYCEIRKKTGAAGTAKVGCGHLNATYLKLTRLGSDSVRALECYTSFTPGVVIDHGRVTDCGKIYLYTSSVAPVNFNDVLFTGSQDATNSLQIEGSNGTAARSITGCSFDKKFQVTTAQNYTITGNVFTYDLQVTSGGSQKAAAFQGNLFYFPGSYWSSGVLGAVDTIDANYLVLGGTGENPHFLSANGVQTIRNNIIDAPLSNQIGAAGGGDMIMYPDPGTTIEGNLLLPIMTGPSAGYCCGVLLNAGGATSGPGITIRHNTAIGIQGQANLGEASGNTYTDMLAEFDYNLFFTPDSVSGSGTYSLFDAKKTAPNVVSPANCHHNGHYRIATPYSIVSSGGSPGTGDVTANPQFADYGRNLITWGVRTQGVSAGLAEADKLAAAVAILAADPSLISAMVTWVKAGYAPTDTTDYDLGSGNFIGAFAPASGGLTLEAVTVSTGTVTETTVALSWTAATGGTSPYTYQIQQAPDSGGAPGAWLNFGSPQSGTSATVTGLSANTTYWFRVVATDAAAGTSTSAAASATTAAAAPAGPVLLSPTVINGCPFISLA